jgi:hypothetical protein
MQPVNGVRYKQHAVAEFLVSGKQSVRKIHKFLKRIFRTFDGCNDLFEKIHPRRGGRYDASHRPELSTQ